METTEPASTQLAGFVLPVAGGRVLLVRHTYAYTELWGMVGGMASLGERLDAAARREAREETGLDVTTERLLAVAHVGTLMMAVYDGLVTGGEERCQPDEIAELRWFNKAEVEEEETVFPLVRALSTALFTPAQTGLRAAHLEWLDGSLVEVRIP